jgi:ActR/RegA family two-component response regulator
MNMGQPTVLHSPEPTADVSFGHVLIADDDPMFRRILQSWLDAWGYPVIVAEDGAQAWSN